MGLHILHVGISYSVVSPWLVFGSLIVLIRQSVRQGSPSRLWDGSGRRARSLLSLIGRTMSCSTVSISPEHRLSAEGVGGSSLPLERFPATAGTLGVEQVVDILRLIERINLTYAAATLRLQAGRMRGARRGPPRALTRRDRPMSATPTRSPCSRLNLSLSKLITLHRESFRESCIRRASVAFGRPYPF